ncbi:MAG: hypothetical protein ACI4AD_10745 [Roseburia sp.]
MTAAGIMTLVIFLIVAGMMIGIGISQLRSTSPVGFYSGEKPPAENELTDVKAWNKKHGMMWLVYGIIIIISYFVGYIMGDTILCLIPFCGGLIVPVIIMIWYHHRLIRKYKR